MNYVKRLVFLPLFLLVFATGNGYSQTTNGIWISRNEIASLPTSGAAWDHLKYYADQPAGTPNLSNQDETANIYTLAKALVYARTGIESYRTEVIGLCMSAIDTELQTVSRVLSLARKLVTYVISTELVGLPPDKNEIFNA